eukprot:310244-Prorocentrum_minimum.AAC.1
MSRRRGVEGVAVLRKCHAAGGLRVSRCYANVTGVGAATEEMDAVVAVQVQEIKQEIAGAAPEELGAMVESQVGLHTAATLPLENSILPPIIRG